VSDLGDFLASEQNPSAPSVARRFGTVSAVNAGPPQTVDVVLALSGITLPAVAILSSYAPVAGDAVVVDFVENKPLAIGAVGAGRVGTLGYAQVTANQGGISTATDLTGLFVAVTVTAGRRIRISASGLTDRTVANGTNSLLIQEGATQLQEINTQPLYGNAAQHYGAVILTPTGGAHTYKLALFRVTGTGTISLQAAATFPAFILVEDVGTA